MQLPRGEVGCRGGGSLDLCASCLGGCYSCGKNRKKVFSCCMYLPCIIHNSAGGIGTSYCSSFPGTPLTVLALPVYLEPRRRQLNTIERGASPKEKSTYKSCEVVHKAIITRHFRVRLSLDGYDECRFGLHGQWPLLSLPLLLVAHFLPRDQRFLLQVKRLSRP